MPSGELSGRLPRTRLRTLATQRRPASIQKASEIKRSARCTLRSPGSLLRSLKFQITTLEAKISTTESRPNATRASDRASMPSVTVTPTSTTFQKLVAHSRRTARLRSRSTLGGTVTMS